MNNLFHVIILLALIITVSSNAQSAKVAFQCKATLSFDANQTADLEIKVVEDSANNLVSYLVGSGDPGPLETTKSIVTLQNGAKVGGVLDILKATGLSSSSIKEITSVVIYTAGNFDDDAAGVRTAAFYNKKGQLLGSGMFFGWSGAHNCK